MYHDSACGAWLLMCALRNGCCLVLDPLCSRCNPELELTALKDTCTSHFMNI